MPSLAGSSPELQVYSRLPVTLVRGEGCRVWDEDGKAYLDLYGGHAVAALGYGHPALTHAVSTQAQDLLFQTNAVHLQVRDRAIARLVQAAPEGLDQTFLVNSGAEANENALRLVFLKTKRTRVTALTGAFHGRTAAAGAITYGNAGWFGFPQTPFEVDWLAPEAFDAIDAAITADTAAVIFEPVQGVAGAVDLSPEFAQRIAARCREVGAVLIVDEVQTGVGRTGTTFAVEWLGITPDILTTAKGLGGGFPVAAVLCSAAIGEGIGKGTLGTTFGGGPVACAAIEAVLGVVDEPSFLADVRRRADLLANAALAAGVHRVTGKGFLMGLHVGQPAGPVRQKLLEKGFLTGDAKNPEVVRLLPPLILSDAEIVEFGTALSEVLR